LKVFDSKVFGIIFVPNMDNVKKNMEIRNNLMVQVRVTVHH